MKSAINTIIKNIIDLNHNYLSPSIYLYAFEQHLAHIQYGLSNLPFVHVPVALPTITSSLMAHSKVHSLPFAILSPIVICLPSHTVTISSSN